MKHGRNDDKDKSGQEVTVSLSRRHEHFAKHFRSTLRTLDFMLGGVITSIINTRAVTLEGSLLWKTLVKVAKS